MLGPSRSSLLGKGKLQGLELLVAVKVALEVLKQDDFLVDRLRVIEEIVLRNLLLVVGGSRGRTDAVDIVKVEEVGVRDDLR